MAIDRGHLTFSRKKPFTDFSIFVHNFIKLMKFDLKNMIKVIADLELKIGKYKSKTLSRCRTKVSKCEIPIDHGDSDLDQAYK